MRKFLTVLLAAGLLFGAVASAHAAKAKKPPKAPPVPTVVMTDAAGDAGNDTAGSLPGAAEQGFDLTEATIIKSGTDLVFNVKQAAMPADGTPGELFRLLWHFNVGGEEFRFTVKSSDVGKPDLVAQSGQDRVGTIYEGVARLESCYVDETLPIALSQCDVVSFYDATFDAATASESWKIPLADVKATTGTLVSGGTTGASDTCMICWIPHAAERSLTPSTIIDAAVMSTTYTVPKK